MTPVLLRVCKVGQNNITCNLSEMSIFVLLSMFLSIDIFIVAKVSLNDRNHKENNEQKKT
jgi:hypothetical protein